MDDDDRPKRPSAHEVGMLLDAMSVEELRFRIELLEGEIRRLGQAVEARQKTRSAAESLFRS
jgi:uncharacterized small protein (DUF1192 family)